MSLLTLALEDAARSLRELEKVMGRSEVVQLLEEESAINAVRDRARKFLSMGPRSVTVNVCADPSADSDRHDRTSKVVINSATELLDHAQAEWASHFEGFDAPPCGVFSIASTVRPDGLFMETRTLVTLDTPLSKVPKSVTVMPIDTPKSQTFDCVSGGGGFGVTTDDTSPDRTIVKDSARSTQRGLMVPDWDMIKDSTRKPRRGLMDSTVLAGPPPVAQLFGEIDQAEATVERYLRSGVVDTF